MEKTSHSPDRNLLLKYLKLDLSKASENKNYQTMEEKKEFEKTSTPSAPLNNPDKNKSDSLSDFKKRILFFENQKKEQKLSPLKPMPLSKRDKRLAELNKENKENKEHAGNKKFNNFSQSQLKDNLEVKECFNTAINEICKEIGKNYSCVKIEQIDIIATKRKNNEFSHKLSEVNSFVLTVPGKEKDPPAKPTSCGFQVINPSDTQIIFNGNRNDKSNTENTAQKTADSEKNTNKNVFMIEYPKINSKINGENCNTEDLLRSDYEHQEIEEEKKEKKIEGTQQHSGFTEEITPIIISNPPISRSKRGLQFEVFLRQDQNTTQSLYIESDTKFTEDKGKGETNQKKFSFANEKPTKKTSEYNPNENFQFAPKKLEEKEEKNNLSAKSKEKTISSSNDNSPQDEGRITVIRRPNAKKHTNKSLEENKVLKDKKNIILTKGLPKKKKMWGSAMEKDLQNIKKQTCLDVVLNQEEDSLTYRQKFISRKSSMIQSKKKFLLSKSQNKEPKTHRNLSTLIDKPSCDTLLNILNDIEEKCKKYLMTKSKGEEAKIVERLKERIGVITVKEKLLNKVVISQKESHDNETMLRSGYIPKYKSFVTLLELMDVPFSLFYSSERGIIDDTKQMSISTLSDVPFGKVKLFFRFLSKKLGLGEESSQRARRKGHNINEK